MQSGNDRGYDVPHPLWRTENRLKTFTAWPNQFVNAASLAHAGFIYVGPGDKVKCVFCYLIIDEWQQGDNPLLKHKTLKPDCLRIEHLAEEIRTALAGTIPESDCNIIRQTPAKPYYQYLDVRKKTFEDWPPDHPISTDVLATAGFFYTKVRDRVQCFYCSLYAEKWEPDDDVYVEHCRLNPKCPYMLLYKGQKFIQQCIPGAAATEPSIDPSDVVIGVPIEVMRETIAFQGYSSIYIDCAFFQQKIKKEAQFSSSESLFDAVRRLPRAEEAASARLKDPNITNAAEIALMQTCKICLQREWEFICLPCKHFTCCRRCKDDFYKCPSCEQFVNYQSIDIDSLGQNISNLDLSS